LQCSQLPHFTTCTCHGLTHACPCQRASLPFHGVRRSLAAKQVEIILIPAKDDATDSMLDRWLSEASATALRARDRNGALLVQGWAGINMAPCMAVALLMQLERMPMLCACQRVQAVRGEILLTRSSRLELLHHAQRALLLPGHDIPNGLTSYGSVPLTWLTESTDALLLLLGTAVVQGTGLVQPDANQQSLESVLTNAAAARDWNQHERLVRRWLLLRCLLDILRR
jgi:hypothetical protein